jgi:hypothetical protein
MGSRVPPDERCAYVYEVSGGVPAAESQESEAER